jgi:hypothetical protein
VEKAPSAIGRLLQEISYEGNARHYHIGGRGLENVLSVEVFQAIDFLPRTPFFVRAIESVAGGSPSTLKLLAEHAEEASFSLLPGDISLARGRAKRELTVQPDGIITSPSVYCMLEAKRIRYGQFYPDQLAREFLATLQEAGGRCPLFLLVLPDAPPVRVKGHTRLQIKDAIARWLPEVLNRTERDFSPVDQLLPQIEATVAYTTWQRVSDSVARSLEESTSADSSVRGSISRLAQTAIRAIAWHK